MSKKEGTCVRAHKAALHARASREASVGRDFHEYKRTISLRAFVNESSSAATIIYVVAIMLLLLCSCVNDFKQCQMAGENVKAYEGSIRIDSIYLDWRNHAHAAVNNRGEKVLFHEGELVIQPEVGDSLYKARGTEEYVLVKVDSTFIQKWDCEKRRAVIVDKWSNRESDISFYFDNNANAGGL